MMFAPLRIAIAASALLLPAAALAMDTPPHSKPGHSGSPQTHDSCGAKYTHGHCGSQGGNGSPTSPTSVPEPGVFGLFAAGLAGAYAARRMKKRRKN